MVLTRINTNISAVNASRNLNKTSFDLAKSLERLSSGLRINRASDDASGLFISEKLRSQIRGLNRAVQNAQDAISLSNTAEGALDETTRILQRIRELSVQAANSGGNDQESIRAAQDEIDLSIQEINRIGSDTQFSTRRLLNGDNEVTATMSPDLGATPTEGPATNTLQTGTHFLNITEVSAGSITFVAGTDGSNAITGAGDVSGSTFDTGTYTISVSNAIAEAFQTFTSVALGTTAGGTLFSTSALTSLQVSTQLLSTDQILMSGTTANGTAFIITYDVLTADLVQTFLNFIQTSINAADGSTTADNVTVSITGGQIVIADNVGAVASQLNITAFGIDRGAGGGIDNAIAITETIEGTENTAVVSVAGGPAQTVTANGTVTFTGPVPSDPTEFAQEITLALGALTNGNDTLQIVQQEYTADLDGGQTVTFQNGDKGVRFKNGEEAGFTSGEVLLIDFGLVVTEGTVVVDVVNNGLSFHIGANQDQNITVSISDVRSTNLGDLRSSGATVADINVTTVEGANEAIRIIDLALNQVSRQRSTLGSVTNRLEATIQNLSVASENLTASESRIRDADIAYETTRFTRNQILLQAGTAILAQANIAPQAVLQLLG